MTLQPAHGHSQCVCREHENHKDSLCDTKRIRHSTLAKNTTEQIKLNVEHSWIEFAWGCVLYYLDGRFYNSLAQERGTKEGRKWNQEVPTSDSCKVKQRVGDLKMVTMVRKCK